MKPFPCKPGDIVQADPSKTHWGPCLVVVEEIKSYGIAGYTSIPRAGRAYIHLGWDQCAPTNGAIIFDEFAAS
jgi:hypothetical protein